MLDEDNQENVFDDGAQEDAGLDILGSSGTTDDPTGDAEVTFNTLNPADRRPHHKKIFELGNKNHPDLEKDKQKGQEWETLFKKVAEHQGETNDKRVDNITSYIQVLQKVGNYSNTLLGTIQDQMDATSLQIQAVEQQLNDQRTLIDGSTAAATTSQLEALQAKLDIYQNALGNEDDPFVQQLKNAFAAEKPEEEFTRIRNKLKKQGENTIEEQARQAQAQLMK